jgi:hypothetical protein
MLVVDAVDGSSTGTSEPWNVGAVKFPTIQRSEPCRRRKAGAWIQSNCACSTSRTRIPSSGLPFSARHIDEAWRTGAKKFGWDRRKAAPRNCGGGALSASRPAGCGITCTASGLLLWVGEAEPVSANAWTVTILTVREEGAEIWVTWNPDRKRARRIFAFGNLRLTAQKSLS